MVNFYTFITLPKGCRHIYNYRIENIYKNIVKIVIYHYAVVRARAWNFDFSSENYITITESSGSWC